MPLLKRSTATHPEQKPTNASHPPEAHSHPIPAAPSHEHKPHENKPQRSEREILQEEAYRKVKVLSQCLEEKAEENFSLSEQITKAQTRLHHLEGEAKSAKELESVINELTLILRKKDEEYENLNAERTKTSTEKTQLQELNEEFERRLAVLSSCLADMAQENLGYSEQIRLNQQKSLASNEAKSTPVPPSPEHDPKPDSGLVEDLKQIQLHKVTIEETLTELKSKATGMEQHLQEKDKQIAQLNTKLIDALNKKSTFQEANELYEQKLCKLEKEMSDNLQQEGFRRMEAERNAAKLRKKVAELEFLLQELEQEDSGSDS